MLSDLWFPCGVALDLLILVKYRKSRAGISESNISLSEVNSDSSCYVFRHDAHSPNSIQRFAR